MIRHAAVLSAVLALAGCSGANPQRRPAASPLDRAEATAHRLQAEERLAAGDLDGARSAIELALRQDPGDPASALLASMLDRARLDEEAAFERLLSSLDPASGLSWFALEELAELARTPRQRLRLSQSVEELLRHSQVHPRVAARALALQGNNLRHLGRERESRRATEALGWARELMLIGPFDNDQDSGLSTAYPPESTFDPAARYPGKLHPVGWRRVEHFHPEGTVDLVALLDPATWSCAYLATDIESDAGRPALLQLGASRSVRLWLNGKKVYSDDGVEFFAADQHRVWVELAPGRNRALAKVCQRTGPWRFGLRVTGADGRSLAGVHFRWPEASASPAAAGSEPERRAETDLLADLRQREPLLSQMLDIAWAERRGRLKQALAACAEFSGRYPNMSLVWLWQARLQFSLEQPDAALKSLLQALRLAPNLPAAVLERARYERLQRRAERAMRLLQPLRASGPLPLPLELMWSRLLLDRGFATDALKSLQDLSHRHPDHPEIWRWLAQAQRTLGFLPQAERSLEKSWEHDRLQSETLNALIELAIERQDSDRALQLIRARSEAFPGLIAARLREAVVLWTRQQFGPALEALQRVEAIAPDYWLIHRIRGDILYYRGEIEAAIASYRRALELSPDNPRLREYLDFLEQRPDPVLERYSLSEEEVERALTDRPSPDAFPDAAAVFLLDDMVTHVFADGSSKNRVRQAYLILNERGQREFSRFRVPAMASFRLESAETIQPDGSRQEPTSVAPGVIHFPALRPGSVIYVAYRYDASPPTWMQEHFAMSFRFQGSWPVRHSRWVLALPRERTLKVYRHGSGVEEKEESLGGDRVIVWSARDVPMIPDEPMSPPQRSLAAAVFVSTIPSWDVLARWQNSLIRDQFEIDAAIREKTRQLCQGLTEPLDKVRAVFEFVARDIRYLDHDSGIFGKKPNKAVEVFGNRFGDCKDKATLMIAMLREVGIQAAYAAIRTRLRGPVFWEVPDAQTDHIVTYIPAQPGIPREMFVDGTSQHGHVDWLPDTDQGVEALVLDGEGFSRIRTPELPPEASLLSTDIRWSLMGDDSLAADGTDEWRGWFAAMHRSELNVVGRRREQLSRELGQRYPGARLVEATFEHLDDSAPAAAARYRIEVPGRVRRDGAEARVNLLWPANMIRGLAALEVRRLPLFFSGRFEFRTRATLRLPAGATAKNLPKALSIDSPELSYSLQCRTASEEVACERRLSLRSREIPPERYPEFRELCRRIDLAEDQPVVLGLPR
jgi:tetratricopeptide (TPR) repeat protein